MEYCKGATPPEATAVIVLALPSQVDETEPLFNVSPDVLVMVTTVVPDTAIGVFT